MREFHDIFTARLFDFGGRDCAWIKVADVFVTCDFASQRTLGQRRDRPRTSQLNDVDSSDFIIDHDGLGADGEIDVLVCDHVAPLVSCIERRIPLIRIRPATFRCLVSSAVVERNFDIA